jgi:hypothetical protein
MDDGKDMDMATEYQWVEVPCQRSVAGANFSQGVQDYVFSVAAPQAWSPSMSYFRAELQITGATGNAPLLSEGIALAEGAANNMYTNAYFLAAGVSASNITNFLAVGAQLKARTCKPGAWLNSVGKSAWGLNASLAERIASVSQAAATGGTVGLSGLNDCREIITRPIPFLNGPLPPAGFGAITLTYAAVNTALVGGTLTANASVVFTAADIGTTIVFQGVHFTVVSIAGPLVANVVETAGPAGPSNDWYQIKRELVRSDQVRNKVQVLFRPPIGIMEYEGLLGAGQYRFQMAPDANYQSTAVETFNPLLMPSAAPAVDRFALTVNDVRFYAAIVKMRIPDSVHTLHLKEYLIQNKVMNTKMQTLSFSVPASTTSMHVFLQDQTAGSTPYAPPSRFTVGNGSDLNLNRIQITYSNLSKPQTVWDSEFQLADPAGSNVAWLQQFYNQGLIENQMDHESAETFNEWLTRGPLYSFRYERDAADRSTDVQLQITYNDPIPGSAPGSSGLFAPNSKVFLCACYDRAVEITHDKGMIVEVRSLDV